MKFNGRFRGTCRLLLLDRRISEAINQLEADSKQSSACHLLHAGFVDFEKTNRRYIPEDRTAKKPQILKNHLHFILKTANQVR
jgi:hypothetical protein